MTTMTGIIVPVTLVESASHTREFNNINLTMGESPNQGSFTGSVNFNFSGGMTGAVDIKVEGVYEVTELGRTLEVVTTLTAGASGFYSPVLDLHVGTQGSIAGDVWTGDLTYSCDHNDFVLPANGVAIFKQTVFLPAA